MADTIFSADRLYQKGDLDPLIKDLNRLIESGEKLDDVLKKSLANLKEDIKLVDPKTLEQAERLNVLLVTSNNQIEALAQNEKQLENNRKLLNTVTAQSDKLQDELNKATKQGNETTEESIALSKQKQATLTKEEKLQARLELLKNGETDATIRLQQEIKALNKAKREEAKESLGLIDTLTKEEKLQARLESLKNGETDATIRLQQEIKALNKAKREEAKESLGLINTLTKEEQLQARLESLKNGETDATIRLQQEINALNKAKREEAKESLGLISTYQRQSKQLERLRIEYKSLVLEQGGATRETEQLKRQIIALDEELKDLDKSVGQSQRNVGNYGEAVGSLFPFFGRLQNSLESIANTPDSFESGLPSLDSFKKGLAGITRAALAFVATPIGAAITALTGISLVVKEFIDYNVAIRESLKLTQDLTGLSGRELNSFRANVEGVATSFDQDFNEVLRSANTLAKSFGIEQTEALDLIQDGFVRGANANDEFLDTLREYPIQFKNAGISAEEFIRISTIGATEGIFSDKLPDTIKEFGLALSEQTDASRDALENAFGFEFTNQLFTNLTDGSLTTRDALVLISDEVDRVGLNSQQAQQLTADLFKGAGEDAGGALKVLELFNRALSEEDEVLTDLQRSSRDLADSQRDLAEAKDLALNSSSALSFRNTLLRVWNDIQIAFFNTISEVRESFSILFNGVEQIIKPLRDLISESEFLSSVFARIQRVFSVFTSSSRGVFIPLISAIKVVGALLSGLSLAFSEIQTQIQNFRDSFINIDFSNPLAFAQSISDLGQDIRTGGASVAQAFADGYRDAFNNISDDSEMTSNDVIKNNQKVTESYRNESKNQSDSVNDKVDDEIDAEKRRLKELEDLRQQELSARQGRGEVFGTLDQRFDDSELAKLDERQQAIFRLAQEFQQLVDVVNNTFVATEQTTAEEAIRIEEDKAEALRRINEQFLIEKDALIKDANQRELDQQNKANAKLLEEAEKARQQQEDARKRADEKEQERRDEQIRELQGLSFQSIDAIENYRANVVEQQLQNIQNQISDTEFQSQQIAALAASGNADAQNSLAQQRAELADLRREEQIVAERQRLTEISLAFFRGIISQLDSGQSITQATSSTAAALATISSAIRQTFESLPSFAVGTSHLEGGVLGDVGSGVDGNGGRLIIAHTGEGIATRNEMGRLKGKMNLDELTAIGGQIIEGTYNGGTTIMQGASIDPELKSGIKQMTKAINDFEVLTKAVRDPYNGMIEKTFIASNSVRRYRKRITR